MVKRTKRERDTQRSRVYKADTALHPLCRVDVSTVPRIEAYARMVWADKQITAAYPAMLTSGVPHVRDGRGRASAGGCASWISMPQWARKESIVLHELAHTISQRVYGRWVAGHGWQYCGVYLTIVRHMMGDEAHAALLEAFRTHGVRFRAPRAKRTLEPHQRAALLERLALARQAKRIAALTREANARWSIAAKRP